MSTISDNFEKPEDRFVNSLRLVKENSSPKLLFRNQNLKKIPFQASILKQFIPVSSLLKLSLNENRISYIPPVLFDPKLFPNLSELELNKNLISQIPPQVGHLISLRILAMGHNHISHVPLTIGRLHNLESCYLDANPLDDPFSTLVGIHQMAIPLYCAKLLQIGDEIDAEVFDSALSACYCTLTTSERDLLTDFVKNNVKHPEQLDILRQKTHYLLFVNPIPLDDFDLVFTTGTSAADMTLKKSEIVDTYITSLGEPLRAGWLTKQGGVVKSWRRRWFILHNGLLKYLKHADDEEPRGIVPIADILDIRKSTPVGKNKTNHGYIDTRKGRSFIIRCEEFGERELNDEVISDWLDDLRAIVELVKKAQQSVQQIMSSPIQDAIKQYHYLTSLYATPSSSSPDTNNSIAYTSTTTSTTDVTTSSVSPTS